MQSSIENKVKLGRNDPCTCGSGKKYKKCCGVKESATAIPVINKRKQLDLAYAHCMAGNLGRGAEIYRQLLQSDPRDATLWNALGLIANQLGKDNEAAEYFQRAISISSNFMIAHSNLGSTCKRMGKLNEALTHFKKAEELDPTSADVQYNLGSTYFSLKEVKAAESHLRKATKLRPDYAMAHNDLGSLLFNDGKIDEAKVHFRRVLEIDPQNQEAQHVMNALEHKNTDRAPRTFVQNLFDHYADTFDEHLVSKLEYHIPQLLMRDIEELLGLEKDKKLDVLDLGCGTGLFGVAVKPLSESLIGVDLSPRMVEKSRARGIYDEVIQSDLLSYLENISPESFDLVAAADVFVYLGNLSPVFEHVKRAMRGGGVFAFSVEGDSDQAAGFVLSETARYRHSEQYLIQLAGDYKFDIKKISPVSIRKYFGQPTPGFNVLMTNLA